MEHRRALARTAATLSPCELDPARPIIATGHQARLWHPGILAKYLAMAAAAKRLGAQMLHLFVDHDEYHPYQLELPVREGDRLRVESVELASNRFLAPPVCQNAQTQTEILQAIDSIARHWGKELQADFHAIRAAWPASSAVSSAHQVALFLSNLMAPLTGPMPLMSSTMLMATRAGQDLIDRMLREAGPCVEHYNRAVGESPDARVAPLSVQLDRVELPLWWLSPSDVRGRQVRQRVFADLADSKPMLVADDGTPLVRQGNAAAVLAPKALLLTALMRSCFCDLFIHGLGGGVYDRVTESWWRAWRGEDLAPMAVVTADLALPMGAPVADPRDLHRARWMAHHLPSNVDRFISQAKLDTALVARKLDILSHMHDDRDRVRRAAAFTELHRINAALAEAAKVEINDAVARITQLKIAVSNRAIAQRRDWFFALYPSELLLKLRDAINSAGPPTAPTAP